MARPESDRVVVRYNRTRRLTPWGAHYREFDPDTRKRERRSPHFATKEEAEAFAADKEDELTRARAIAKRLAPGPLVVAGATKKKGVTVAQHVATYLQTHLPLLKGNTFSAYESVLRLHIVPVIGDVVLSPESFTVEHVKLVVARAVSNGYGWGMRKNILKVLSACLGNATPALAGTLLPSNPALGMARALRDRNWEEPPPNPLTYEQQEAFLAWLQTGALPRGYRPLPIVGDRPVDRIPLTRQREAWKSPVGGFAYFYPWFLFLLRTGVRRGEGVALVWERVFLDARRPYVIIARNYSEATKRLRVAGHKQYAADGMVTTKTAKERRIYLATDLADVLREMARTRRAEAFRERRHASPLVFTRPNAPRPLLWNTCDRVLAAGMEAIGARHENHTMHALRDTFATLHLERGTPLAWVSETLGHSKRSTTLDRYSKWVPQEDRSAAYADELMHPPAKRPRASEDTVE